MKFSESKAYTSELKEIIDDYNVIHGDYDKIIERMNNLKDQIAELDLLRQESEVKLLMNRDREKRFIQTLQENDFEAYLDLTNNIQEYVQQKILGQNVK